MHRHTGEVVLGLEPTASSDDNRPMTVERFDNHIYFYSAITTNRCLDLIKYIREADSYLRSQRADRCIPDEYPMTPIYLHINSPGGHLLTALGISDQIKAIRTPIVSITEGCCASAATLISMACSKRLITPSSFMLIHRLRNMHWGGSYEQLKDKMQLCDMIMKTLRKFYVDNSTLTKSQVKRMLKRESWFSAKQCLDNGLVDRIESL